MLQQQSVAVSLSLVKSEVRIMATSLKKRNAERNKYVVNFAPSSSLNRRLLVFLLTAVALVTVAVFIATLIPIYLTGRGDDKGNGK